MNTVPLTAVPSQNFSVSLGGQAITVSLYQLGVDDAAAMFIDLESDGVQMISCRQCRAYGGLPDTRARFLFTERRYLGFQGDLLFIDTQATATNPTEDPQYSGLGARWQLVYFSVADLAAAGLS